MTFLILFVSLLFLTVGLVFIYKPFWIIRFNKLVRERILNDNLILLERRKKGFFFLLAFFIFFYWGYTRSLYSPSVMSAKLISTQRLLYQSEQHLRLKEYQESRRLCEEVLLREPGNPEALYQLGAVQFLLNDTTAAQNSWGKAKAVDSASEWAGRMRKLVVRHKNLPSEDIPAFR